MFARKFWKDWFAIFLTIPVGATIGCAIQWEWDKEAYAMRGRSNMFKEDYRKLKQLDPTRELWK